MNLLLLTLLAQVNIFPPAPVVYPFGGPLVATFPPQPQTQVAPDNGFLIGNSGGIQSPTLSATRFIGVGSHSLTTTEDSRIFIVPIDCTARNLYYHTGNTQSATGLLTVTLRNVTAAVDTALTLTVAAGAGAGSFSNTSDSVALTTLSQYTIKIVNSATAAGAQIIAWGFQCN